MNAGEHSQATIPATDDEARIGYAAYKGFLDAHADPWGVNLTRARMAVRAAVDAVLIERSAGPREAP